jgi:hypothetical protein
MKGGLVFENLSLRSIRLRHFGADPPLGPGYAVALDSLSLLFLGTFVAHGPPPLHRSGTSWGLWSG